MLEIGKALTFGASIVALSRAAMWVLFLPATRWQDRVLLSLPHVALAGCVCFVSGLLFCWPARSNPDADQPLLSTLPVRLFLWAMVFIGFAFLTSLYLVDTERCMGGLPQNCIAYRY
jgi:hypothetical protein